MEAIKQAVDGVIDNVEGVIVGKRKAVELVLIALLCKGHVLLEDVPGTGKTTLAKTIARSLGCSFKRIQFTPDLLPSDVTGISIFNQQSREFEFRPGPVIAQIVLADEINRATPKTQSALLEAMQEHTVTVAKTIHRLADPFFVLATQNPLEMEGTYPLPEAQLDRFFFKILVPFPTTAELVEIANRTTSDRAPQTRKIANGPLILAMQRLARSVPIASHVLGYAARLISATHPEDKDAPAATRQFVRYGASPRGMQALILAGKIMALLDGRFNVAFADLKLAALPALRHRLILNFEAQAEGVAPDDVIRQIVEAVKTE